MDWNLQKYFWYIEIVNIYLLGTQWNIEMNSFLSFYYFNKDVSNNEDLGIIINMSLQDKIEVHRVI